MYLKKPHTLPAFHKAVIDDDLEKIAFYALKHDRLKDAYGFTAKELALLLRRKRALPLLMPHIMQPIYAKIGEKEHISALSWELFKEIYNVQYTPALFFESYEELINTIHECPWTFKKSIFWEKERREALFFYKKLYSGYSAPVYIKKVNEKVGYGLFAMNDLLRGSYIGEYAGKVRHIARGSHEHNEYCIHYPTKWLSCKYHVIDALQHGNHIRFINHSDSPNAKPIILVDRGIVRIVFFAVRDIDQEEEIVFDYGPDFWKPS